MTSKDRFYNTLNYAGCDRPLTRHKASPEITHELMAHFCLSSYEQLLEKIGDDFRQIRPEYIGPELKTFGNGTWEGIWGERYKKMAFSAGGEYNEMEYLPFAEVETVDELKAFTFPSADWYDYTGIKASCAKFHDYVVIAGNPGVLDFLNGLGMTRGVEQTLIDVATENEVFQELVNIRFNLFMQQYERILDSANGLIDVVLFGDDLGNQNGLTISPVSFDKIIAPKIKEFCDMVHSFGAKTMFHSCGSTRLLIPRFIELGIDMLEILQIEAKNMDLQSLYDEFYGKIIFGGTIGAQSTLPYGTADDVRQSVQQRKELFKQGGMMFQSSHNIQAGTPLKNVIAMYDEIGSLQ